MLPNRFSDTVVPKAEEKLPAEDTGKSKGNIAEENVRGLLEGVLMILQKGHEGVYCVKRLAVGAAGALGRGKKVVPIDFSATEVEDSLFSEHTHGVDESEASVVDRVKGVKGVYCRR